MIQKPPPPFLTARADGLVGSARAVAVPIMAPRLQGEVLADHHVDLSLWGGGRLGQVRFSGLDGPYIHAPNRVTTAGGGVFVAQSAPVLVVRGAWLEGIDADWNAGPSAPVVTDGDRVSAWLPGGGVVAETRGSDVAVALGADRAEGERGLALSVADIVREADAYAARCDVLPTAEPVLRSMAIQAAHAALSSIRRDKAGGFAGLAAGEAYSTPARTYYRDGYWTIQTLLRLAPEAAREEIDLLALGIRPDGEAPSGLILPGADRAGVVDWWSDHFDSPLLFVLMIADHVRATGETDVARRHWPAISAVFARYQALARDGHGLPRKPRNDRDWADNVYRQGHVAYDVGLWIGVLDAIVRLGQTIDPELADAARRAAAAGRAAIDVALWSSNGWYSDFAAADGFIEDHLSLDGLTLLRFDAVSPDAALAVLAAVRRTLESRHNTGQPFGDWGVLCAFPPYRRAGDTRAKSSDAYRYHNGGDWPWLDGLYAGERLRRGLGGWRYPLLRWWEMCLANGWMGAVEHFSPPFGRGSLLQAWSSLPLAVALAFKDTVLAGDTEASAAA